jgi:hypothetical protein
MNIQCVGQALGTERPIHTWWAAAIMLYKAGVWFSFHSTGSPELNNDELGSPAQGDTHLDVFFIGELVEVSGPRFLEPARELPSHPKSIYTK